MTRADVVLEARSWLGTPYVRRGMIKGGGCDCFTFPLCVYHAAGFVPPEVMAEAKRRVFSDDWFCHVPKGFDPYFRWALRCSRQIISGRSFSLKGLALPGDLVLARHNSARTRTENHSGIITEWPRLLHSVDPVVTEVDVERDPMWDSCELRIFSPFKEAA